MNMTFSVFLEPLFKNDCVTFFEETKNKNQVLFRIVNTDVNKVYLVMNPVAYYWTCVGKELYIIKVYQ